MSVRVLCATIVGLWAAINISHGQPDSWTNSVSGKWEDLLNWSSGVPSITHSAVLVTNAGTKVVTINAATAIGAPSTLTISNLTLSAPVGDTNTLRLSNVGAIPVQLVGGLSMPGNASLLVYTNSQLVVTNGTMSVGSTSVAQLTVSAGSVRGADVYVTRGALNVAGGTVTLSAGLLVGAGAGATGTVWVTDGEVAVTGSAYDFDIYLGAGGLGQFTLSNGVVRAGSMAVGYWDSATGLLRVDGGTIQLSSSLVIPAESATATGNVWVTGGQLFVTNAFVGLGEIGVGQMVLSNGMVLVKGLSIGPQGTLTIAGGKFEHTLNSELFSITGGLLQLTGGELVATNIYLDLFDGGQLVVSSGTARLASLYVNTGSSLTAAGGTTTLSYVLDVGEFAGSTGRVWITGGRLVVTNHATTVGRSGAGQISVSNTGLLDVVEMTLGKLPGAVGTLSTANGSVHVGTSLILGNHDCSASGFVVAPTVGAFQVTNMAGNTVMEIRSGAFTHNYGYLAINRLVITNACGRFISTAPQWLDIDTLILAPEFDADDDGMPNGFEQGYSLNPLVPSDASLDFDGDGLNNLQEFAAGTSPIDPSSTLIITGIATEGGDLRVTWSTAAGKTNALQAASEVAGNYDAIFTVTNTTGSVTNYLDSGAATNWPVRFYRVRLVP